MLEFAVVFLSQGILNLQDTFALHFALGFFFLYLYFPPLYLIFQ